MIWQTGEPLVVDDYDVWSGRAGTNQQSPVRTLMAVPLKSGDQVVGAIGLARDPGDDRTFGTEEVELLSRFAQLASVALDNARLYAAAQETQRRLTDIIDFLPDATVVIDGEGRVIAWNRAIEEMTGVSAEADAGQGRLRVRHPLLRRAAADPGRPGVHAPGGAGAAIRPDPAPSATP